MLYHTGNGILTLNHVIDTTNCQMAVITDYWSPIISYYSQVVHVSVLVLQGFCIQKSVGQPSGWPKSFCMVSHIYVLLGKWQMTDCFFKPCTPTHTHTYIHRHRHAHTHTCMHARTHAHTHTHTHCQLLCQFSPSSKFYQLILAFVMSSVCRGDVRERQKEAGVIVSWQAGGYWVSPLSRMSGNPTLFTRQLVCNICWCLWDCLCAHILQRERILTRSANSL